MIVTILWCEFQLIIDLLGLRSKVDSNAWRIVPTLGWECQVVTP